MASKLFPHVFTPGRIGTLELKNRVMKAPQSSGMSNKDGTVSERLIRYYRNQASGGAGMIIVEYAYVDDIGAKSAHCHLGISQNEHIPGLTWLAENIKECGAAAGIQIEHCGRQKFLGTQPMCAPSAIPWPKLWDQYGLQAVPHVLTIEEIQDIVHAFGDAAWRAKVAGFDLVEIHGAHGYLLTNFFSPTTNHRTDLYGGTLENRMRIYIEIARDVRKKVGPDFPVTIRLSGTDYEPDGFPIEDTLVLAKALEQAKQGRLHILGKILETIPAPRPEFKPHVPRIEQIIIPQDFIGAVIGPGGKVIQEIQKSTGTTITITEKDNKGLVDIFGENKDALEAALARIKGIVAMPEVGEVYKGKIRSIVAFGAFVEILPGKDGLLHISEIANRRFETMEQTGLKEGDMIEVKLIGLDPKNGKLKLSRKALLNGKKE